MFGRDDEDPAVERQRILFALDRPHADQFVAEMNRHDKDIGLGFTVEADLGFVKLLAQIAT